VDEGTCRFLDLSFGFAALSRRADAGFRGYAEDYRRTRLQIGFTVAGALVFQG